MILLVLLSDESRTSLGFEKRGMHAQRIVVMRSIERGEIEGDELLKFGMGSLKCVVIILWGFWVGGSLMSGGVKGCCLK